MKKDIQEEQVTAIAPIQKTMNTPSLKKLIEQETHYRTLITEYISSNMVDGKDYGSLRIGGKLSKPSLFKPGAEKIGNLLKLRPDVIKDDETWEMTGRKPGVFCYRCNLYNKKTGVLEGMGLGACTLEEKQSYNNAIKIAKKRAFVDAVLSTGCLSDFFTQDLEDATNNHNSVSRDFTRGITNTMVQRGMNTNAKATEPQKTLIIKLVRQKSKTQLELDEAIQARGASDIDDLTIMQASEIIKNLMQLPDIDEPVVNIDDIPEDL